jgi:pyruvate/2-oxoglutarate dehydrogenase complex dihydrolipoamide acyltransferase (E2) component
VTERQTEALEKLNRGILESRQDVQQRTMNLAQEYFGDSAEVLKQQIKENRATLENLPDQIPGGREEAFQALFQELMENYSAMEESISEAQKNVANLDTDQIRRQGEVDATDAARRQARELGVDLTKIKGTGTDGRIIVSDVVEAAEAMGDGAAGEGVQQVQDAAGGATRQAQDTAGQAVGQAQQMAGQATDQVGQVAGQAQDTAGQATGQAGQAVQGVQDTVGGLTGGGQQQGGGVGGALGGVTDQVGEVAQGVQDTAGQAAQQGQQAVGQAAQQATGGEGEEPRATNAARRRAQQLGVDLSTIRGTGSGGLITIQDVVGS